MSRPHDKLLTLTKLLAGALVAGGVALLCCLPAATGATASPVAAVKVIASGLDQPKKVSLTADGDLLVALSGDGAAPRTCTDGDQVSCTDRSGAIDELSPNGHVSTLLRGLSSVSSGGSDGQATGPAQALAAGNSLQVLFQGSVIDPKTGRQVYGSAGSQLEKLIRFSAGGAFKVEADLGRFEARHDSVQDAGTEVKYGQSPIDSDPYSIVAYRGGYAIADAGANDLLFVSPRGRISVLAAFPTIREWAPAGSFGSGQKHAIEAQAQAVPTAVVVGPDGALYVGELGGIPYAVGRSVVYRILPGHRPTVYASGLTAIADIAFDSRGRLLVLEIDRKGLNDPGFDTGRPTSGVLLRIARNGVRQTLISTGLIYPTGIAVRGNTVYVSDYGVSSADVGDGGEILQVTLR
jgi:ABC-type amino acid transport substrate-binding protein